MTFRASNRLRREWSGHRRPSWPMWVWFIVGVVGVCVLAVMAVLLSVVLSPYVSAAETKPYRVPGTCHALADRFLGGKRQLSRGEAKNAVVELERASGWPGVPGCLQSVRREWRF